MESAWSIPSDEFENSNCGNFLALVVLISKYDPVLERHLNEVTEKSKQRHDQGNTSKGRGSFITLLSKTTVNKLINIIGSLIKETIVEEVLEYRKFGIEVDSTQDDGIVDQLAICLRYVKDGEAKERLLAMCDSSSSTGTGLHKTVTETLSSLGLDPQNIIGQSYDGAANMSGKYAGQQALIKHDAPNSTFTHFYAHRFNLLMTDATTCCLEARNLYGLIESTAVFMRNSYKRMNVWKGFADKIGEDSLRRLKKRGDTRWTSKDQALESIIGCFGTLNPQRLVLLLVVLHYIATFEEFEPKVAYEANNLRNHWMNFKVLLVATVYSRIFQVCTPVSKYLQTNGMDILAALKMVNKTTTMIESIRNEFEDIVKESTLFATSTNSLLDETDLEEQIATELPVKRVRRNKKRPSEKADDEILESPMKQFRVNVFNVIIDSASSAARNRFGQNENILQVVAFLDPQNFSLCREGIPEDRLHALADLAEVDRKDLCAELTAFAEHFDGIVNREIRSNDTISYTHEADKEIPCVSGLCQKCLPCVLLLLHKYNLHCILFTNLYVAYKVVLSLPCTQVKCESFFFKTQNYKKTIAQYAWARES